MGQTRIIHATEDGVIFADFSRQPVAPTVLPFTTTNTARQAQPISDAGIGTDETYEQKQARLRQLRQEMNQKIVQALIKHKTKTR